MSSPQEPSLEKAEEYQREYGYILNAEDYDFPENTLCSYHSLVEDMIETIQELEEYQAKQIKLQASARTGIN